MRLSGTFRMQKGKSIRLEASGDTLFEVWAKFNVSLLQAFGLSPRQNPEVLCGYFLDFLNQLPERLRGAIAQGVILGKGLDITDGPDGVPEARLVDRYPPLVSDPDIGKKLWLPSSGPFE